MASRNPDTPNIVFMLSDDQGQWAAGCYGNGEIRTPSLDALAASGARFSSFFCTSPVCSPARASLLTGRIPSQHGVHDWIRDGNTGANAAEYLRGMRGYTDVLREAGYRCGLSGKWHMGDSIRPQKGFTHWYAHQTGGGPYYGAPMIRDGECYDEPAYVTDAITDDAIEFLDRHVEDDEPFYLSVHYTAPHSPWIDSHPADIVASYDSCEFSSCPDEPWHPWFNNNLRWGFEEQLERDGWEKTRRETLKGYFAAVTSMDSNIGRIISALDRHDLRRSTLVVFSADNGMNMGHHGVWGKGNGTLPQNMYDTSVKVPAIFNQIGKIPQSAVCDELVSGYDFFPTLLDYVSISNPIAEELPGRSFAKCLEGESRDIHRDEVVVFDEYGPVRMIRTRDWKYVHRYYYGPDELYDLSNDPNEEANLIEDSGYKTRAGDLRQRLDEWFDTWVDPELDGSREPVEGMGQLAPLPARFFSPADVVLGKSRFVPVVRPDALNGT